MKFKLLSLTALLVAGMLVLSGCNKTEDNPEGENVGLANPASVYCEENWGTLQIETDEDDGQYWICLFGDGSYCEEWSYYRNECQPGEITYNTVSDENYIDDVEVKFDWNGTSEVYSDEYLQTAVDTIMNTIDNEWNVKVEMQEISYQWDEESDSKLDYCKELNAEVDKCIFFKTNFYIPEQDVVMAGAFEPNKTITDYEWYLGEIDGGEWFVLGSGY